MKLSYARRIDGKTYYYRVVMCNLAILFIFLCIDMLPDSSAVAVVGVFVWFVAVVYGFLYLLGVVRERANDIGSSPGLMTALAIFTPLFFFFGLLPGERKSNAYGPVPKWNPKLSTKK